MALKSFSSLAGLREQIKAKSEQIEAEKEALAEQERLKNEDRCTFLDEMRRMGVQSAESANRVEHAGKKPAARLRPRPAPLHPRESAYLSDDWTPADEQDSYRNLNAGIGEDVVKKLRHGTWTIQDEIDLHGMTSDEAREELTRFVTSAFSNGERCIKIIHGKGWGSHGQQPVLKKLVRRWLRQRSEVLAYVEPDEYEGGSGALLVLLAFKTGGHR